MSNSRRVYGRAVRTPEELAELKAERERFSRERPSLEELTESGEYEGPFPHGALMTLLSAIARVRLERERRGMTLAVVSKLSGLDQAMLSRLENGKIPNPTFSTLWRYARAVGVDLELVPRGLSEESMPSAESAAPGSQRGEP
jgi:hypothetical protein